MFFVYAWLLCVVVPPELLRAPILDTRVQMPLLGLEDASFDMAGIEERVRPRLIAYIVKGGVQGAPGSIASSKNARAVIRTAVGGDVELCVPDSLERSNALTEFNDDAFFDCYSAFFKADDLRDKALLGGEHREVRVWVPQLGEGGEMLVDEPRPGELRARLRQFEFTVCLSHPDEIEKTPLWLSKKWKLGSSNGRVAMQCHVAMARLVNIMHLPWQPG